jgi:competence ComEA-like helix-hairpin-helix protein
MKQDSRATLRSLRPVIVLCALALASSCVKLPRKYEQVALLESRQAQENAGQEALQAPLLDINTASPEELEKLPGIGRGLAARIVAHREQYGRFRRAEHLIMVRGIGERRYRKMRAFIKAG